MFNMLASPLDFTNPRHSGKTLRDSAFYSKETVGLSILMSDEF